MASVKVTNNLLLPVPPKIQDLNLNRFIQDLVAQISLLFNDIITNFNEVVDGRLDVLRLTVRHSAPVDVKEGWMAFADGTDWNPGSGAGLYEYRSAAWHKL